MTINIFDLSFCQPLVWVVLALIALMAIPNVLFYRELSVGYYPEEQKRLKIFNWVLSLAIVGLWVAIIVANHTTVWNDLVNFVFLIGVSPLFGLVAALVFILVVSALVCVIMVLYYLVLLIMTLFGKMDPNEDDL
ncbi:MAG: hypothetical protein J6T72_00985 [Alphaproteobacteria bacterium]|nr:hypothetical protein [Alphaproteobacteria bacterium]